MDERNILVRARRKNAKVTWSFDGKGKKHVWRMMSLNEIRWCIGYYFVVFHVTIQYFIFKFIWFHIIFAESWAILMAFQSPFSRWAFTFRCTGWRRMPSPCNRAFGMDDWGLGEIAAIATWNIDGIWWQYNRPLFWKSFFLWILWVLAFFYFGFRGSMFCFVEVELDLSPPSVSYLVHLSTWLPGACGWNRPFWFES